MVAASVSNKQQQSNRKRQQREQRWQQQQHQQQQQWRQRYQQHRARNINININSNSSSSSSSSSNNSKRAEIAMPLPVIVTGAEYADCVAAEAMDTIHEAEEDTVTVAGALSPHNTESVCMDASVAVEYQTRDQTRDQVVQSIGAAATAALANGTKQFPAKAMKQKAKRKHGKTCRRRMTSNFLKNAAPLSTIHQTYTHLSTIKPRKARRNINANLQHVEQITLKTVKKNGFKGKFMETSWGWKTVGEKKYPSSEAVSIDSFKTLDSTDKKFILAFDESEPPLRIFAKASRQIAKQRLGAPENIEITRRFAVEVVEAKP
eukprot:jgi/Psemu1/28861/gm1.28861_g